MPIRNRATTITRILLFVLTSAMVVISLDAQERIEWEPVDGADHYRVEIRREGTLVLETRCDEAWLPLFLPVGEYDFRIKVINAFDKTAAEGEWKKIKITAVDIPFIIDLLPTEIHAGGKPELRARVSGYREGEEGSIFRFEDIDGNIMPLSVERIGDEISSDITDVPWTEVVLSSGRKSFDEGLWDLVMLNPDGRENRMASALTVLEKHRPRIRSVSPDEFSAGLEHNPAMLRITGMEEGAVVEFLGPSDIIAQLLNKDERGNLEYSFNLLNAEPGWYSIVVTNPSGGTDSQRKAFRVLPKLPNEENGETGFNIDKKDPRILPDYPHTLSLGWNMSFPLGDSNDYYSNDFIGLSIGFSQDFHNDLIRRIPWLKGLRWEGKINYSYHQTEYPLFTLFCHRLTFEGGIQYITPFDFPLNLLIHSSAGVAYSIYTSPEYDRDDLIYGTYKIKDLDSFDFIARIGLGGRIDIAPRWFIDLTLDAVGIFYLSRTSWTLQPHLKGGLRW